MERAKGYRVPPGQSVVFNLARVLATMAVFIGHATKPDVLFDRDVAFLGRATIPVFLMLSGYLTACSLTAKHGFARTVLRRYTGLYGVVLPAILVHIAADQVLKAQDSPILANPKFEGEMSLWRIVRESVEALTYSGEYWRLTPESQGLFANQAYWTVEYIMAYMVVTAALYLLSGWRRLVAVLAMTLVAGPTVLLLAPLWFAGVAAFEIHRRCARAWALEQAGRGAEAARWPRPVRSLAPWYGALGFALVALIEITGWGAEVYGQSKSWAPYEWRQYLGMAKRYAWQWSLVPGLFLMVVASKYLIDWQPGPRLVALSRQAAIYTLPIYIFHFSMIYVAQAVIPGYDPTWRSPDPYLMMLLAMGLTLGLSWLCLTQVKPVVDAALKKMLG